MITIGIVAGGPEIKRSSIFSKITNISLALPEEVEDPELRGYDLSPK